MSNHVHIFVWIYGLVVAGMDSVNRTLIEQYERDSSVVSPNVQRSEQKLRRYAKKNKEGYQLGRSWDILYQ
jgi:hypothetical protein